MIKNEDETARVHFAEGSENRKIRHEHFLWQLEHAAANTSLSVIHRMIEFIFIVP